MKCKQTKLHVNDLCVQRLRSMHDSVSDVAEQVNGLFSLQILLALAVVFIDATLNIFYSYTQIAIVVAGQGADLASQIHSLYWVALSAVEIVVMATVCESAANEVTRYNKFIFCNFLYPVQCKLIGMFQLSYFKCD